MRCLWTVWVGVLLLVPGVALGADPVADYLGAFETLRASLSEAGTDCSAAAGAIEGWHGKHGAELDELEASIRAASAGGQLGDDALAAHEQTLSAISEQLSETVTQCTDDQSVVTALALLGDHSEPGSLLARALAPPAGSAVTKFAWGPQCRRMLATMDAMCKAHGTRPEVAEMCTAWNQSWNQMPTSTPPSVFEQMEAGCGEAIPALEQAAAHFAATAPPPPKTP